MYKKQSAISSSQNLKSKLSIKDHMTAAPQIHSQPQSSKGNPRRQENKQDYNSMRKKLFNMLGKNSESNKFFKVSPTNSLKQQYFVSVSMRSNSKMRMQKQNHTTENNNSQKSLKCNAQTLLRSSKERDSNKYCEILENNNIEMQKQFGNFVKSVDKIQPDQLQFQNTEKSSLIALFERLNAQDKKTLRGNQHNQQELESTSLKQSIEFTDFKYRQKLKGNISNNSSGQLINPNSTTTQIHLIEQKNNDLMGILDRTKYLLQKYSDKLKQADCEKDVLIQEIQYWKSKFLKSQQQFS